MTLDVTLDGVAFTLDVTLDVRVEGSGDLSNTAGEAALAGIAAGYDDVGVDDGLSWPRLLLPTGVLARGLLLLLPMLLLLPSMRWTSS